MYLDLLFGVHSDNGKPLIKKYSHIENGKKGREEDIFEDVSDCVRRDRKKSRVTLRFLA